jgi:hypothetical protein
MCTSSELPDAEDASVTGALVRIQVLPEDERTLTLMPVTVIRRFALAGRLLDGREHPHMNSSTGRSTILSAALLGDASPQRHGGTGPR